MSNCSPAMEPKERRTCGNCNNCDFFDMECSYIEEDGTHRKVTMDTPACADWERRVLTDEERYERLAQVARDMLRYARIRLHEHWTEEDANAVSAYREELERLGVSVDD